MNKTICTICFILSNCATDSQSLNHLNLPPAFFSSPLPPLLLSFFDAANCLLSLSLPSLPLWLAAEGTSAAPVGYTETAAADDVAEVVPLVGAFSSASRRRDSIKYLPTLAP